MILLPHGTYKRTEREQQPQLQHNHGRSCRRWKETVEHKRNGIEKKWSESKDQDGTKTQTSGNVAKRKSSRSRDNEYNKIIIGNPYYRVSPARRQSGELHCAKDYTRRNMMGAEQKLIGSLRGTEQFGVAVRRKENIASGSRRQTTTTTTITIGMGSTTRHNHKGEKIDNCATPHGKMHNVRIASPKGSVKGQGARQIQCIETQDVSRKFEAAASRNSCACQSYQSVQGTISLVLPLRQLSREMQSRGGGARISIYFGCTGYSSMQARSSERNWHVHVCELFMRRANTNVHLAQD